MSEPIPVPAYSATADNSGLLAHVEQWAQQHVAPDLTRVLTFAESHAANAQQIADVVLTLAKQLDPGAYPAIAGIVTEAEKALAEAERIAQEFLGKA